MKQNDYFLLLQKDIFQKLSQAFPIMDENVLSKCLLYKIIPVEILHVFVYSYDLCYFPRQN